MIELSKPKSTVFYQIFPSLDPSETSTHPSKVWKLDGMQKGEDV